MTDFLDELIPSMKGGTATKSRAFPTEHTLEEPSNFHRLAKHPDAIVLAMIRTRCQCCGAINEYPSQWLLHRFGKSYSWTTSAAEADPELPHEIRTLEIENANCRACFPATATQVHVGEDCHELTEHSSENSSDKPSKTA